MMLVLMLLLAFGAWAQGPAGANEQARAIDTGCTAEDRAVGLKGVVALRLVIDEKGRPHDAKVVRSLRKDLDKAAVDALKKWRFDPAKKDGKPVRVMLEVEVNVDCTQENAQTSVKELQSPRPIYTPDPEPPASKEARRATIDPIVLFWARLGEDGMVQEAKVQRSCGNAEWDNAAMEALKKWKFQPATKAGIPYTTEINVEVNLINAMRRSIK